MNDDGFDLNNKFQYCSYSSDLIKKILLLNQKTTNKVDLMAIKKAIYYAKKYHSNQMRKSGEPYYSHPLIVAGMVADHCFKTDILVTAILHDTIEDTSLTKDTIMKIFGLQIANNVEDLTRIKPYGKVTAAATVQLLWSEKKYDLLLIKYFDRLHNLQTIDAKSTTKIQETIKETMEQFLSLGLYFEKSNIPDLMAKQHMDMVTLCLKKMPNKQYKASCKNSIFEQIRCFVKSITVNIVGFIRYKLITML